MGNGSPRPLRHLLVRTAACVLALLTFAPPASADAGLVSVAGAAAPDPAIANVGVSPLAVVETAADIARPVTTAAEAPVTTAERRATPVATPQIAVSTPIPSALATNVAAAPPGDPVPPRGHSSPQQRPLHATVARSASPSRHPTTPQSAAGGIAAGGRVATVPGPDARAIELTRQAQPGAGPAGTGRPPLPLPPAPFPLGGGAGDGAPPAGTVLVLLFALAAEAAALIPPSLRRRIVMALAAPRPYPYLLRLERPD
jgi:hypothetical protein